MYRPFCCLTVVLLAGCAATDGGRFLQKPADSFEAEYQALLDQPYIDPLTSYLIEHQGDPQRASTLVQIRQERDRRCQTIARQYADEPATRTILQRYNLDYGYSCPEQVAEFENRFDRQQAQQQSAPEPVKPPLPTQQITPSDIPDTGRDERQITDQALSDCYLLTSIRNYSAARTACAEPADQGDLRAQVNMARIAHLFEDYDDAVKWAQMAAPESGAAAFLLGQMYAVGQGVGQNRDQAVYWFNEAVKLGNRDAEAALDQYR